MAILDKIISAAFKWFGTKKRPSPRRVSKPSSKAKTSVKRSRREVTKPKVKKEISRSGKKKAPRSAKRIVRKLPAPKKITPSEERIGVITHYFSRIQVVVIKLNKELKVGEKIHIKGRSSDFIQLVKSLQIESVDVKAGKKGDLVGLKVNKIAKEGDLVFRPK